MTSKNDEAIEISDLPDEEASSAKKRWQPLSSPVLLSLLQWSHQHRRVFVLFSICLIGLTVVQFLGSILPLQQLQQRKGLALDSTSKTGSYTLLVILIL